MTRIAGVDPGLGGALSLLEDGRFVETADMPTMVRSRTGKKQQVNAAELARILREWGPDVAVVELVVGMHRPGASRCHACNQQRGIGAASAFNFGESCGSVRGVLAALGIETHYVTPQVWKKRAGLKGSDKEASRMRAVTLWPTAPLARKKDSGRAEALLIGRFGLAGNGAVTFATTEERPI